MKQSLPDQVTFFSTWIDGDDHLLKAEGNRTFSLASLKTLWRLLHEPNVGLVVCHTSFFSPWDWRLLARLFDRRMLRRLRSYPRTMGTQILRLPIPTRVAVVDHEDVPFINRNNFFLLDRAAVYFKRELPPDYWRVFMKTGHANLPTPRFRLSAQYKARIAKLKPISLGLPLGTVVPPEIDAVEKSVDIFFSGAIDGSSVVRQKSVRELLALRDRGYSVDVPERRLSKTEFYSRCASARLTWSPEGLGWDCFRHYEAAMCRSVPLINNPTIERYRPLLHGRHAIYYDVEDGGLTRAAISALSNKSHLDAMGRAAQAHVLAHHTPNAIARYIVRASLHGSEDRQSGE